MPSASLFPKPDQSWPTWAMILYWVVASILMIVVLGGLAVRMFKFIPKGSAGLLTRRCRPVIRNGDYVRKGPGIHWVIPFTDNIEDISLLDDVTNCASVLAENKQTKKQYVAEVRPTWCVIDTPTDLHNAIFRAKNLAEIVETEVMCAVGVAIEAAKKIRSREEVQKRALKSCRKYLRKTYGINLKKLGLVSVARVPVQVLGDTLGSQQAAEEVRQPGIAAVVGATVTDIGAAVHAQ